MIGVLWSFFAAKKKKKGMMITILLVICNWFCDTVDPSAGAHRVNGFGAA